MKINFDESLNRLLAHEGGYTNHPADPGGPTNWGITIKDAQMYWKAGATAADVRAMPLAVAKAIYKSKYWNAMACDQLPSGVDYAIFDYAVNSGLGRAGKVLRRVLKMADNTSAATPGVVAVAQAGNAGQLVRDICDERLRFLKSLSTWPVFGVGWGRRVSEVRFVASGMVNKQITGDRPVPIPFPVPGKGEVPVNKPAQKTSTGTIAGGGAVIAANGADAKTIFVIVVVTVALAVGVYFYWHWRQRKQQEAKA